MTVRGTIFAEIMEHVACRMLNWWIDHHIGDAGMNYVTGHSRPQKAL